MQAGDIPVTCADIQDVFTDVGFKPSTSIEMGMEKFVDWYLSYYKIKQCGRFSNDVGEN